MSHSEKTTIRSYFIYIAVITANILSFGVGVIYTWAATIVPILKSNDTSVNPLPEPPTALESSWIVSIAILTAIIGPLIGGTIANLLGRKKAILLLSVPVIIGNLISAFATKVWMFLVARMIMGVPMGCCLPVMTSYSSDIAEDKNRGLIFSLTPLIISIGALFVYGVGPFISIKLFSLISIIPFILQFVVFGLFVPDTPYSLIQRNAMEDAKKSLSFYRGKSVADVETEFQQILVNINRNKNESRNEPTSFELLKNIFKSKAMSKGFKIVFIQIVLQQLSGVGGVSSYYQTIFEEAGGSIDSVYSVIIIGVVSLISTMITSQLVERLGRKMLLMCCFTSLGISLFGLGAYFFLKSNDYDVKPIGWLPIVSLMMFVIGYNFGISIPWVLITDIFFPDVTNICSSMFSTLMMTLTFIFSLIYPFLTDAIGNYGAFFLFGSCMAAAVPYTFLCIPETKGKSIESVQRMLS